MRFDNASNLISGEKGLSENVILSQWTPRSNIGKEDAVLKDFGNFLGGESLYVDIIENLRRTRVTIHPSR